METKTAHIIVDLGYGDAGKGTIVDALARKDGTKMVVRYNGGAQAGHNVVTPDGRHHTFSQFGSATFVPGVLTHLSRFMVMHPLAMLSENEHLRSVGVRDALERLSINHEAPIITPYHQAVNRLRELARSDGRHGSCGLGVGETVVDYRANAAEAVRAGDLADYATLMRKLKKARERMISELKKFQQELKRSEAVQQELALLFDLGVAERTARIFADLAEAIWIVDEAEEAALLDDGDLIFEGAQGVLLDQLYGFWPYTTWSDATTRGAHAVLKNVRFDGSVKTIGVVRAYATRHGPGPFVSENAELTDRIPDAHNPMNPWQRGFRVGWFDVVATRYALDVVKSAGVAVDALAVTNFDRLGEIPEWRVCSAYRLGPDPSAAPYFRRDRDEPTNATSIRRLQVTAGRDMAVVTKALEAVRSHEHATSSAVEYERRVSEHGRYLESALELPITIESHGPTADRKRWRY